MTELIARGVLRFTATACCFSRRFPPAAAKAWSDVGAVRRGRTQSTRHAAEEKSREIYETDSATASAANRAQAGGGARPGGAPDWSAATRASTVGCVRSQRDGPSSLLKYACA